MKFKRLSSIISPLELLSWALLVVFTGVLFFRPIETGDIWWHLKAGEYIFTHNVVPLLDPFPVMGEKTLWVLTQWLGSLLYFMVYHIGGFLGLKFFRVFVVLVALWQFRRFCIRCGSSSLVPFLGLLLVLAVATRPHLRPFLFNAIYLQIFLSSLFQFDKSGRVRSLIPILLTGPLWMNTHMGSFVYGFTLIGVFLLSAGIRAVADQRSWRTVWFYLGLALFYALLFVLNPYGLHGALHPWRTLFVADYLNFGLIKGSISELQPPALLSLPYLWFYPTMLLGGCAVYVDKDNRFRNLILFACGLFLFMYGQRAAIFFALISLYLFAEAFTKIEVKRLEAFRTWHWVFSLLLCVGIITMGIQEFQKKVFWQGRMYRQMLMTEAYTTPGPILADLAWREVSGVVFNDDAYGGYMLWKSYPQLKPFVDTRQIHVQNFQLYNLVLHDPHRYWGHADMTYRFKAVILDANKAVNWPLIRFIQRQPEWSLVAVQGDQIVFLRSKQPLTEYISRLAAHDAGFEANRVALQAIIQGGPQHRNHYTHMETADTALTLFELGYPAAALERLVYSFRISNSPYQHNLSRIILNHL
ncbi:MAG: hypothetical protein K8I00_02950 [Candidatus Omnitrophica bacterium]|nr:hypothetical protein [Candidatus Omnitrophota bacterium]